MSDVPITENKNESATRANGDRLESVSGMSNSIKRAIRNAVKLANGEAWLVAIGSKGCVASVARTMSDDKRLPSYTCLGVATKDLPAVAIGKGISAPWSGRKNPYASSNAAFGAYVSQRAENVTIIPLDEAIAKGMVKPLSVWKDGKEIQVFVQKAWKTGELLPQYLATIENGPSGRIEPRAHPDATRRAADQYTSFTFRVSLTPPAEVKPTVKPAKPTVKPTVAKLADVVKLAESPADKSAA